MKGVSGQGHIGEVTSTIGLTRVARRCSIALNGNGLPPARIPISASRAAGSRRAAIEPACFLARPAQGGSFDMMIVPEAANMLPTPSQTEILAPRIWAGAAPRLWRALS